MEACDAFASSNDPSKRCEAKFGNFWIS